MGGPNPLGHLKKAKLKPMSLEWRTRHADALEQRIYTFDVNKPAAQLRRELPYDDNQLWAIVNTPTVAVERRAKILEVIMHRIGERAMWATDERWKEFRRNSLYALYNDPAVFDQLSKSTELVPFNPPGIFKGQDLMYPASFLVQNTVEYLSIGPGHGLDQRGRFEEELTKWPPETRGRLSFHLEDAYKLEDNAQKAVREDVERILASQYGKMTAEGKNAFRAGYTQARDTTNFPKDGPDALPK